MFATAGTLKPDADGDDSFGNHRESVLRSAKTLVEDTKALVSVSSGGGGGGGGGCLDQTELARCVQTSVKTIARLADSVKLGAASLGSEQPDAQILVINAVRDVAAALRDLVGTIKQLASGGNSVATANTELNTAAVLSEAAKAMITSVQSLLKTIKTVEDEAQRGTRALEAAIDAVGQEVRLYTGLVQPEDAVDSPGDGVHNEGDNGSSSVVAEDLIKATRQITLATSRAIGAGNSLRQEDVIVAANMGRKAVSDLLYVCRNVRVGGGEKPQFQRKQILTSGLNCVIFYKELLDSILNTFNKSENNNELGQSSQSKQGLIAYSKNVANSVADIIRLAESLKDADDWIDPEDPAVIAENELLGAADTIESAANKLARLKPRTKAEAIFFFFF